MKDLLKKYLDSGISRRQLMRGLSAVGVSGVAAKTLADSFAPTPAMAQAAAPGGTDGIREVKGNGGMLYMQQLKSAGVKYMFFNPSTGDAPFYDAAVDSATQNHLVIGWSIGSW